MAGHRLGRGLVAVVWIVCGLSGSEFLSESTRGTSAALAGPNPRSSLERPDRPGPIFVLGTLTVGGTGSYDFLRGGFGAALLFRPSAAADFLGFLYAWNTAMVWQADYRPVDSGRRLLGADFILRRYLRDMRRRTTGFSPFVGLGLGAADVTFPIDDQSGHEYWFSYVLEYGYELAPADHFVLVSKAQWRYYDHSGRNYSGWSLHFSVGIPIPW